MLVFQVGPQKLVVFVFYRVLGAETGFLCSFAGVVFIFVRGTIVLYPCILKDLI